MIQYALKCSEGHKFDSWFQSAAAFDKLQTAGMLSCSICGSSKVSKVLMAPAVRATRSAEPNEAQGTENTQASEVGPNHGPLSSPATPAEQMIAELRKKVESSSEYVGTDFANQARAMHDGSAPEKPIYGEAKLDEARKLIEEGVPVLPLPFRVSGKDN